VDTNIRQKDSFRKIQPKQYLTDEVTSVEDAIKGAQDIIAEQISDNPKYRSKIFKRYIS
jgi:uncharacterized protein